MPANPEATSGGLGDVPKYTSYVRLLPESLQLKIALRGIFVCPF